MSETRRRLGLINGTALLTVSWSNRLPTHHNRKRKRKKTPPPLSLKNNYDTPVGPRKTFATKIKKTIWDQYQRPLRSPCYTYIYCSFFPCNSRPLCSITFSSNWQGFSVTVDHVDVEFFWSKMHDGKIVAKLNRRNG